MIRMIALSKYVAKKLVQKAGTLFAVFICLFSLQNLLADDKSSFEQFSYTGDILYRGYYLWRDILIPGHQLDSGAQKTQQAWSDYHLCNVLPDQCQELNATKQREEEDFSTIRLRVNMAFRPSSYADILYATEVGHLTFGREKSKSGPGSGGRGSGRVNIETRELLMRLHDKSRELIGDIGIFNFSTPSGIVIASSGAGGRIKYDFEKLRSTFELNYIHSVDNSRVDGDSNGFSDSNFVDNRIGLLSWNGSLPKFFKYEMYGVFRSDGDATIDDPTENNLELSNVYWAGLYVQFNLSKFALILHGIGNWGKFNRPIANDPDIKQILGNKNDPLFSFTSEAVKAPVRKNYYINAGAAQIELNWYLSDTLTLSLSGTGASGRIPGDQESDGSSIDYRPDQFRHAGTSFSYTEIALDDSGGYSLFNAGQLTGVTAGGIHLLWQIDPALSWKTSWYKIKSYRTPNLEKNTKYQLYTDTMKPSNDIGEEWNTHLEWEPFSDFTITTKLAHFNAGSAYKALYDVAYGDEIYEFSVFLKQKF